MAVEKWVIFCFSSTSSVGADEVSAAGPYTALGFIFPCLEKFRLEAETEDKKVFPIGSVRQNP